MKKDKIYFGRRPKAHHHLFLRWILKAVIFLGAAFCLLSIAIYFWLDVNAHKPFLERLVKQQTPFELKLKGPIKLTLFNNLHLAASDVHLSYQGKTITQISDLNLDIALLPLIQNHLELAKLDLHLNHLNIQPQQIKNFWQRYSNPPLDKTENKPSGSKINHLDLTFINEYIPRIETISITELDLYIDQLQGFLLSNSHQIDTKKLHIQLHQLPILTNTQFVMGKPFKILRTLTHANLDADFIRIGDHAFSSLIIALNRNSSLIELTKLTTQYHNHSQQREIKFDLKAKSRFKLNLQAINSHENTKTQFELEQMDLALKQLNIHSKTEQIQFEHNQITIRPLRFNHKITISELLNLSHQDWLRNSQFKTNVNSSRITYDGIQLNNLDLQLINQFGQFELDLKKLGLISHAVTKTKSQPQNSVQINSQVNLSIKGQVKQKQTNATHIKLTSDETVINVADQDIYRLKPTEAAVSHLTLFQDDEFFLSDTWEFNTIPQSVSLKSQGIFLNGKGVKNVELAFNSHDKVLKIDPIRFNFAQSQFQLSGMLNLSHSPYDWNIQGGSEQLNMTHLLTQLNQPNFMQGQGQFSFDLYGESFTPDFTQPGQLEGQIEFNANKILIQQTDLDNLIDHFESTQSVGLFDVGAYAIAGPVGVVLVKGNSYHNLNEIIKNNRGSSEIEKLHLKLTLENGELDFQDSALTTQKHLLAAKGGLNLNTNRYHNLQLATIDSDGCALYVEKVTGPLEDPQVVGAQRIVKTVINPLKIVVKNTQKILSISCQEPFYQGELSLSEHSKSKSTLSQQTSNILTAPKKIIKPIEKLGGVLLPEAKNTTDDKTTDYQESISSDPINNHLDEN